MHQHQPFLALLILLTLALPPPCLANWRENTGFLALLNEAGSSAPDGKGTSVCFAESSMPDAMEVPLPKKSRPTAVACDE